MSGGRSGRPFWTSGAGGRGDERGGVIDAALPAPWAQDRLLVEKLREAQAEFDAHFIDDGVRFEALDFPDEEERRHFEEKLRWLSNYMRARVPEGYVFEDRTADLFSDRGTPEGLEECLLTARRRWFPWKWVGRRLFGGKGRPRWRDTEGEEKLR